MKPRNSRNPIHSVSQALLRRANHSTDHRAQTMAVLHTCGYEGTGQDFLAYLHRSLEDAQS